MEKPIFDLLPLEWWENPWYLIPLSLLFMICLLILAAVSFYYYRLKRAYPHKALQELRALVLTFHQQKMTSGQVYSKLVHLVKEWFLKNYTQNPISYWHATDQELLVIMYDKLPLDKAQKLEQVLIRAEEARFAARECDIQQLEQDAEVVRELLLYIPKNNS